MTGAWQALFCGRVLNCAVPPPDVLRIVRNGQWVARFSFPDRTFTTNESSAPGNAQLRERVFEAGRKGDSVAQLCHESAGSGSDGAVMTGTLRRGPVLNGAAFWRERDPVAIRVAVALRETQRGSQLVESADYTN